MHPLVSASYDAQRLVAAHPVLMTPGAQWLAAAHPNPLQVWQEWTTAPYVALLPAGRRWDAVSMSAPRLLALQQDAPDAWPNVPVLADRHGRRYVLTAAGASAEWCEPGTAAHGAGTWLVASLPGGPARDAGWWITPPGEITRLMHPEDLRAALRRTALSGDELEASANAARRALEGNR